MKTRAGPRNPLDAFVLAEMEKQGLAPSPEAERGELLRRLSFDLTGLPPTPEELRAFRADTRPDAYERQVDRLLASPHFGERMALSWLDLVRYADTVGYHSDNARTVWRYRDYVIDAFNRNLPFDRFTAEQLAGDLLPDADAEQKIASGYNRLLQTTEEGGAQPKEYRANYLADRVRNASSGLAGRDRRLRPVPRPQVRPLPGARLLPLRRLLCRREGEAGGPARARTTFRTRSSGRCELAQAEVERLRKELKEARPSATPRRRSGSRRSRGGAPAFTTLEPVGRRPRTGPEC